MPENVIKKPNLNRCCVFFLWTRLLVSLARSGNTGHQNVPFNLLINVKRKKGKKSKASSRVVVLYKKGQGLVSCVCHSTYPCVLVPNT